jgi:DNA replicative helicase MCM subunit Mcm2 (Cdc46/Mcm family)
MGSAGSDIWTVRRNGGTRMTEPIAYVYQADFICDDCYTDVVNEISQQVKTPDDIYDEYSFDSDDFPKAVFTLENSRQEHCGNCHEELETSLIHDSGDDECECCSCDEEESE